MSTDIHQHPHHHRKHHSGGHDEPIPLVEVLKQEVRSIVGLDVDADYPFWMLSLAKPRDIFLLEPEQIFKPGELLDELKTAGPGSIGEILRHKLPPAITLALSSAELAAPQAVVKLVSEFNALLKNEQPLLPDEKLTTLGIPPELLQILRASHVPGKWVAVNRLILQFALPNNVLKVSDTLPGVYAWLHAHPRTAVCFSGGGIRSATFGLGVMQGLARHGLLEEFDYLSTVSGGGYVGSWLSAWISREGSAQKVFAALSTDKDNTPLSPEPEQVRHLREFSNYLTPKLGLLSADTWTLVGTYLRNLLLNWVIFIPALATLLLVPRMCVASLRIKMGSDSLAVVAAVGVISGLWAIVYAATHRPSVWKMPENESPKKMAPGSQARFLIHFFAPLWICSVCSSTLWAWLKISGDETRILNLVGATDTGHVPLLVFMYGGAAFHFVAWCCYAWRLPKGKFPELLSVICTGGFGGMLLWLGTSLIDSNLSLAPDLEWYVCLSSPCFLLAFLLTASIFIGITSRITTDSDREWWARMGAWLLIGILGWSLFSILVLFGPECLWNIPTFFASIGGISTLATLFLGYNDSTPANKKEEKEGNASLVSKLALAVAAPLFIACLIATISLATSRLFKAVESNPAFAGAAKFRAYDVKDLPLFAAIVTQHTNAVPAYVWNNLSPATRQQLQDPAIVNAKNSPLRSALATNLNEMIQKNDLYRVARAQALILSPQTESLTTVEWHNQRLMRFNRLILQDAFPESLANDQFDHRMITHQTPLRTVLIVLVGFWSISWLLSRFISINRFSLYAVYRNRIIRAYPGASNPKRRANPFSGFDPADNLSMAQLRSRPFHVVNIALNLVTGDNLAWQQRKAESFTATRLHAGNYRLGFRDVTQYASHESLGLSRSRIHEMEQRFQGTDTHDFVSLTAGDKTKSGLTLGTAVAISGAAASPNSGYHSSPIVAVLMTLFNVRLGAWLGNPGSAGNKSYKHRGPQSAVWHVVKEALGLTDDTAKYVYLSDGGHFENLGLYEMVLRRVHFIVVSDAGCDPDCALEDLGNAIRKIRIDLGIPIEIDQFNIGSRTNKPESKYCAIGHIDYSRVDGPDAEPGVLIYIKPAIAGNEPRDVFNYAVSSLLFPHEPTSDQWFSESQFESYRMLGMHIIQTMCNGANEKWASRVNAKPLERFKNQASDYLGSVKPLSAKDPVEKTILPGLK